MLNPFLDLLDKNYASWPAPSCWISLVATAAAVVVIPKTEKLLVIGPYSREQRRRKYRIWKENFNALICNISHVLLCQDHICL